MFNTRHRIQNTIYNIQAFTLIELIIVMALMVVLAIFGFLNISNYQSRQNLNSASQQIVAVLRSAQDRSLAQENGSRWGVHFENPISGSDFYSLFQGSSYSAGAVNSQSGLSSGVQFDTPVAGSSSTIIFSPITGLPDAALTVKISLISNSMVSSTITINSNGKIQY